MTAGAGDAGARADADADAGAAPQQQAGRRAALDVVADLAVPIALYYGLRSAGTGLYVSLLVSAAVPAAIAVARLVRGRRVDGLALYTVTIMVLGAAVSLIAGSPRFLLAREGWITGVTGVWFLASVRFARRPLAFSYSRPMLERRLTRRGVPGDWEQLWERLPAFRRIWRVATVLWGLALLADSVLRVVMAYSLPVDAVPALGTALYSVTSLVLLVVTNTYYRFAGLFNGGSALYAPVAHSSTRPVRARVAGDP